MQCPVCNVVLLLGERQGVEIDYCPQCRGVWLGRGVLDRILERAAGASRPAPGYPTDRRPGNWGHDDDHDDEHGHEGWGHDREHGGRRRRGFLDDLLDFG